jgi:hypothetical protein
MRVLTDKEKEILEVLGVWLYLSQYHLSRINETAQLLRRWKAGTGIWEYKSMGTWYRINYLTPDIKRYLLGKYPLYLDEEMLGEEVIWLIQN